MRGMERPVLKPSATHPITVSSAGVHIRVRVGDEVVADSAAALVMREGTYPPVHYVPLADVTDAWLRRSDTTTYCPFKGDASYYGIVTPKGETVADAVWTYEQPFDAVAEIAGHLAFYPDKVQISVSD